MYHIVALKGTLLQLTGIVPALTLLSLALMNREPDHIFELPVYNVAEDLEGEIRELVLKTDFPKDRWIVASEARPGDTSIVTAIDAGPLGAYQSGNAARRYPKGTGRLLKAGDEILVRIHYRKDAGYSPEVRGAGRSPRDLPARDAHRLPCNRIFRHHHGGCGPR